MGVEGEWEGRDLGWWLGERLGVWVGTGDRGSGGEVGEGKDGGWGVVVEREGVGGGEESKGTV